MIAAFRQIALGGSSRGLRRRSRIVASLARLGALLTVLVFFADTINADILYAAIMGDVRFEDNPLILDSATDATSVVPNVTQAHPNYFELAKYNDSGAKQVHRAVIPRFYGTTILEDVDSPSVLDGETTDALTFSLHSYDPALKFDRANTPTTLDRTITYSRLLI